MVMESFDVFGVMIDMSRNAVMNLPALKRFLILLKRMGYNCAMLYMEDTYEVDGEPYFGYMRGRYSKEEMKDIDLFAASIDMEIIPCIQTLAHLNSFKRWRKVSFDCDDILLVDDERTYDLINNMFATLSECFASRRIHIGMDEAHMLGKGKHQQLFGTEDACSIMKRHLSRVTDIAKKYGYEPMIWSDMFFRPWNAGEYYIPEKQIPQEYISALPDHVIPVYWDYYQTDEQKYINMLRNHKQLSDKTWFAGGAYSWYGMIPYNRFTIQAMSLALNACKKEGVRNVVITMWGDDGAEGSHFAMLPALFYLAEYAKQDFDESRVKSEFKKLFKLDFDDFMMIDCPNDVVPYSGKPRNPSKYMLYADCFNDFLDYTVKPGGAKTYSSYAEQLHTIAKKNFDLGYLFESAARLCDVLAVKYELGLRTRVAYEAGDKENLRMLADNEYAALPNLIEAFADSFEQQWMRENKPHGFDIQDMRLGGLIRRVQSCRRRILDYVNGRMDKIEELEEALLPFGEKETSTRLNLCPLYATVNVIHHNSWTL